MAKKTATGTVAKKKATDTFWDSRLNNSDVAHLTKVKQSELEEELNDAVERICEGYEVA